MTVSETAPAETKAWSNSLYQFELLGARNRETRSRALENTQVDIERSLALWGDTVKRLAFCKTRNLTDAEDITQTVFLKLCERNAPFESDEHLKAWLLRVTLTCTVDMQRSSWHNRHIELGDLDGETKRPSFDCSQQAFASLESVLTKETVTNAVAELSEKQRIAIHLYYFEELSIKQIALIMGENSSTVRSHLRRARTALKTLIGGSYDQ